MKLITKFLNQSAKLKTTLMLIISIFFWGCEKDFMSGPTENFILSSKIKSPQNVAIEDVHSTGFTVRWNKSKDSDAYRLYIAKDSMFLEILSGFPMNNIEDTVYRIEEQILPNQQYFVKVLAENKENNKSFFSDIARATTLNADAIMYLVSSPFPMALLIKQKTVEGPKNDYKWVSFIFQYFIGFGEKVLHFTGDKEVVVQCTFDKLFVLSKINGDLLWRTSLQGIASIPCMAENTMYVTSNDGTLFAFDKLSGAELWNFTTSSPIQGSPTVAESKVFVGNNAGLMYAIEKDSGKVTWTYNAKSKIPSNPAVYRNTVVFSTENGNVIALDKNTGTFVWQLASNTQAMTSPIINNDKVYVSSQQGIINAFDVSNGKLVWQYDASINSNFSVDVVKNKVIYCGNNGQIQILNATTGNFEWSVKLSQSPTTQFTVSKFGKIYLPGVGLENNEISILDIETKSQTRMKVAEGGMGQVFSQLLIEAGDGELAYPVTSGNK